MAVTTWTAGQVLTAADLNDTLASKVDYALPVNAQTGTAYTFVAADAEKLTTASNGSAVTLTIPPASSVAWPDETILRVVNYGAGAVTIDGGSGVTVTNTSSTIAQYGAAVAIRTGSDAWTVVPFGGGDVPPATVSSPAATGQYTDGGGQTWDYYTFTSSGTLTVDTAGFADVLVIGGGGGGGEGNVNYGGGGGGAGGYLAITDAYVAAGTLTVTVGAGGATSTSLGAFSTPGNPSRLGDYYAVGGAPGMTPIAGTTFNAFVGGSGYGGAGGDSAVRIGGAGLAGQGNAGGDGFGTTTGSTTAGGGGGGAGATGGAASSSQGGAGGAGTSSSITGSAVGRAGGGGGSGVTGGSASDGGGAGGGGAGTAGTANTGGGGGAGRISDGAAGGSGVVIVRVKV